MKPWVFQVLFSKDGGGRQTGLLFFSMDVIGAGKTGCEKTFGIYKFCK
ncbi:MAG: hypothetical protein PUB63_09300 [Clostridia bacterium]|nr:hypothetical protein [Clostridia bacterium]